MRTANAGSPKTVAAFDRDILLEGFFCVTVSSIHVTIEELSDLFHHIGVDYKRLSGGTDGLNTIHSRNTTEPCHEQEYNSLFQWEYSFVCHNYGKHAYY